MYTEKQNVLIEKSVAIRAGFGDNEPDWYGGMYIKDGLLIVLSTDITICRTMDFADKDVVIEAAEFSYPYMRSIKEEILCKLRQPNQKTKNTGLPERFVGCGIFDDKNRIIVTFEHLTESDKIYFRECISNSPSVLLTSGRKPVKQIAVQPGDKLSEQFTMGYAATIGQDNVKGFVTCGHINNEIGGEPIRKDGIAVGVVLRKQNDKNLDASFSILQLNRNISNIVANNPNVVITEATSSYLTGASVTKFGAFGGKTVGQVCSLDYSTEFVDHVVACNYISVPGDSGSPVLLGNFEILKQDKNAKLIGIHIGTYNEQSEPGGPVTTFTLVMQAVKINQAFELRML